mmetsp:Transcript_28532/g.50679  ORF Transcript_28532/g.50679 Transcript_28532/m.50679 type:complete len:190 (-) Transcript_28532:45-614(-)
MGANRKTYGELFTLDLRADKLLGTESTQAQGMPKKASRANYHGLMLVLGLVGVPYVSEVGRLASCYEDGAFSKENLHLILDRAKPVGSAIVSAAKATTKATLSISETVGEGIIKGTVVTAKATVYATKKVGEGIVSAACVVGSSTAAATGYVYRHRSDIVNGVVGTTTSAARLTGRGVSWVWSSIVGGK